MASLPVIKLYNFAFFALYMITMLAVFVSSFQLQVGGEKGWIKPTGNQTETYNRWATKHRFHVGDTLYFKYQKDSVVVVNYTNYKNCIVTNPIYKFEDGNTVFIFDRHGFYYFISGKADHCKAGQKLVIRVMVQSEATETPQSAPSPKADEGGEDDGDGWDSFNWGPPSLNSTDRLSVASYFMSALGGILVILYLFI